MEEKYVIRFIDNTYYKEQTSYGESTRVTEKREASRYPKYLAEIKAKQYNGITEKVLY